MTARVGVSEGSFTATGADLEYCQHGVWREAWKQRSFGNALIANTKQAPLMSLNILCVLEWIHHWIVEIGRSVFDDKQWNAANEKQKNSLNHVGILGQLKKSALGTYIFII